MGRIFIDVTQSCRSSNNSGIQVVTRNLFRELEHNPGHVTIPMIWDNRLLKYARLSHAEQQNLKNPFPREYVAKTRPNKQENPFWKEFSSTLLRLGRGLSLKRKMPRDDIILLPEVFRDNRVFCLPRLLHPDFRKTAIFYDANVLRNPMETPKERMKNFLAYINILGDCDAVSCISEESRLAFEENIRQARKPRQVDVHRLPVEPPRGFEYQMTRIPPLILVVSTLGYNKNHLTLLEAARSLWEDGVEFELEFVGQSDPSWAPKVLKILKKLQNLGRPIKWLRHIDQDTLEKKYSICSFTVYPSLYEGFGLPIVESLIRGKPCVCGSNGALGEVSRGGGCLILKDQKDPRELAKAIRRLLTDTPFRERLISEALRRDFGSWKQYSYDLLNLFLSKN